MSFPTFSAAKLGYGNLWRSMRVRPERRSALEHAADKILRGKARYQAVEKLTGVPWEVIGLAHYREANCSFACHLHNGDNGHPDAQGRLTVRTRQVPAGRPASAPPWTWEESARDALAIDGLDRVDDWSIERLGYMTEKFNGEGYFDHDVNSPYLWAGSNHYGDPPNVGKYVADHVFDPHEVDTQLGCMPLLAVLMEKDASIAQTLKQPARPTRPTPVPTPTPASKPTKPTSKPTSKPAPKPRPPSKPGAAAGGLFAAIVAAIAALEGAHPLLVLAFAVAVGAGLVLYLKKKH